MGSRSNRDNFFCWEYPLSGGDNARFRVVTISLELERDRLYDGDRARDLRDFLCGDRTPSPGDSLCSLRGDRTLSLIVELLPPLDEELIRFPEDDLVSSRGESRRPLRGDHRSLESEIATFLGGDLYRSVKGERCRSLDRERNLSLERERSRSLGRKRSLSLDCLPNGSLERSRSLVPVRNRGCFLLSEDKYFFCCDGSPSLEYDDRRSLLGDIARYSRERLRICSRDRFRSLERDSDLILEIDRGLSLVRDRDTVSLRGLRYLLNCFGEGLLRFNKRELS